MLSSTCALVLRRILPLFFALIASATWGQSLGWKQLPGAASDIGVGANGQVWIIGTDPAPGGYGIYRWNGKDWGKMPGAAVKIDVDPKGDAWVVNDRGLIFSWTGSDWNQMPGLARDIGIGHDGQVWIIGINPAPGGYGVYRWHGNGWQQIPGGAVTIDAGPKGFPWVVNDRGGIFWWTGNDWIQMPGLARDIGIGADGTVYIVGTDAGVYSWNGRGWDKHDGSLARISVGPDGAAWGVNAGLMIFAGIPRKAQVTPAPAPAPVVRAPTASNLAATVAASGSISFGANISTGGAATNSQFFAQTTNANPPSGYTLGTAGSGSNAAPASATTISGTVSGLKCGQSYYLGVTVNNGGNNVYAISEKPVVAGPCPVPSGPPPGPNYPDTIANVGPGVTLDGISLADCLSRANANGFPFVNYTKNRTPARSRCNLFRQQTVQELGTVGSLDWDLYLSAAVDASVTYPNTIANVGPGAQIDGISLAQCLNRAKTGGFRFANYTKNRVPANSRCNLFNQQAVQELSTAGSSDWDLYLTR